MHKNVIRRWFTTLLLAAGAAHAAPVVQSMNPGYTFQAYTGTAAVNAGNLDRRDVLFRIQERQVDGVQSWYLFFDPAGAQSIQAVLDFGAPILDVFFTSSQLAATRAAWQVDVDGDGVLDDYATTLLMGLEGQDRISWSGSLLSIAWNATDPGDHVRVLVQALPATGRDLPEPGSLALAGLALAGLAAARRRRGA